MAIEAGGGERPDEGASAQDATADTCASTARPASGSSTCASGGCAPLSSVDVPMWQVAQWVFDLRWQMRSWWAKGSATSATKNAARTSRRAAPLRGRRCTTVRLYGGLTLRAYAQTRPA